MRPVTYSLKLYRGASYRRTVRLLGNDGKPIDTVGCRSHLQVRHDPDDPAVLLDASDENGMLATAANGAIKIAIPAALLAGLEFEDAVYDLKLVWPDGVVDPVLKGSASVEPSPTVIDKSKLKAAPKVVATATKPSAKPKAATATKPKAKAK